MDLRSMRLPLAVSNFRLHAQGDKRGIGFECPSVGSLPQGQVCGKVAHVRVVWVCVFVCLPFKQRNEFANSRSAPAW